MRIELKSVRDSIGLTFIMLVMLMAMTSAKIKTDFSGNWVLDQQKSSLGEMGGRLAAVKLKVTQEGNIITIVRTNNGQMGEVVTTDKLTFDGKESVSTGGREGSTRTAVLKPADDQNALTVNSVTTLSVNGSAFTVNAKEVWSLSADAKTLTINAETTTQMGVTNTKLVYTKQ